MQVQDRNWPAFLQGGGQLALGELKCDLRKSGGFFLVFFPLSSLYWGSTNSLHMGTVSHLPTIVVSKTFLSPTWVCFYHQPSGPHSPLPPRCPPFPESFAFLEYTRSSPSCSVLKFYLRVRSSHVHPFLFACHLTRFFKLHPR